MARGARHKQPLCLSPGRQALDRAKEFAVLFRRNHGGDSLVSCFVLPRGWWCDERSVFLRGSIMPASRSAVPPANQIIYEHCKIARFVRGCDNIAPSVHCEKTLLSGRLGGRKALAEDHGGETERAVLRLGESQPERQMKIPYIVTCPNPLYNLITLYALRGLAGRKRNKKKSERNWAMARTESDTTGRCMVRWMRHGSLCRFGDVQKQAAITPGS